MLLVLESLGVGDECSCGVVVEGGVGVVVGGVGVDVAYHSVVDMHQGSRTLGMVVGNHGIDVVGSEDGVGNQSGTWAWGMRVEHHRSCSNHLLPQ